MRRAMQSRRLQGLWSHERASYVFIGFGFSHFRMYIFVTVNVLIIVVRIWLCTFFFVVVLFDKKRR